MILQRSEALMNLFFSLTRGLLNTSVTLFFYHFPLLFGEMK